MEKFVGSLSANSAMESMSGVGRRQKGIFHLVAV